mgnify:CR=1 FL=1
MASQASASRVIVGGAEVEGPGARTVLVFETPAAELALDDPQGARDVRGEMLVDVVQDLRRHLGRLV